LLLSILADVARSVLQQNVKWTFFVLTLTMVVGSVIWSVTEVPLSSRYGRVGFFVVTVAVSLGAWLIPRQQVVSFVTVGGDIECGVVEAQLMLVWPGSTETICERASELGSEVVGTLHASAGSCSIPVAAGHIVDRKKRLSLEANALFLEKASASRIASTIAL
jgi:hypothetical protein